MAEIFIGVDPGLSGAIAAIKDGVAKIKVCRCDTTETDLANFLLDLSWKGNCWAFIERVSAMPGNGVSSMFKFGRSYGFLRGILIATGISFEEVNPVKWQSVMGCRTKGDKNVSKARAQQLFPAEKIIHANADAILIAEYCRRVCMERSR